ncbi:GGDEF domain-containing protein (plasmid) [Deinococcus taeanensis]|uniref:GGDEF domain-containing protein n=1 Tax=Deinococcus taeanensis TaxID=2737050 RepID=UPI001CDC14D3|nr:GGDEF domain-containing protein [Deinococcus taeanensis]UBV44157.1 GGDEF domain-containing protein [Deinococcus taeanensis]
MKRWVRHPLVLGLAGTAVLFVGLAGYGFRTLEHAFERSARITQDTTQRIEVTLKLQKLLQRAALPVHHYHIDGHSEQRMHFRMLAGEINGTLSETLSVRSGSRPQDFAAIASSWRDLQGEITALLALPDPNAMGLRVIHARIHALDEEVRALSDRVGALHDADRIRTQEQLADAARWNRTLTVLVTAAFLVTVLSLMLGAAMMIHSQATLRDLSMRDALTGLFNRREFQARLRRQVELARRQGGSCAVLLLDVDHFKAVNDTYGHEVGDLVLRELAEVVCREVRRADLVARFGGEELVVLLPHTDKATAVSVGQRVQQAVAGHPAFVVPGGAQLTVTVSVGVAAFPADAPVEEALLRVADQAMYAAKRAGRNQVTWQGA